MVKHFHHNVSEQICADTCREGYKNSCCDDAREGRNACSHFHRHEATQSRVTGASGHVGPTTHRRASDVCCVPGRCSDDGEKNKRLGVTLRCQPVQCESDSRSYEADRNSRRVAFNSKRFSCMQCEERWSLEEPSYRSEEGVPCCSSSNHDSTQVYGQSCGSTPTKDSNPRVHNSTTCCSGHSSKQRHSTRSIIKALEVHERLSQCQDGHGVDKADVGPGSRGLHISKRILNCVTRLVWKQRVHSDPRSSDLEKGGSDSDTNVHVSVNISGMTCTTCSKKALNVLARMSGVQNPKLNFVTESGEFDLDSGQDPTEVILQLERETGFRCSQTSKDLQTVEVTMCDLEAKHLKEKQVSGISSMSKTGNKTYSVNFDPAVIGARSLLALVPSQSLSTAHPDVVSISSRRRLWQLTWSTLIAALLTIPVVVLAWSNNSIPRSSKYAGSLVLATCVQGIAIPEFYVGAIKSLIFSRVVEIDMLVVISITAAYVYSVTTVALIQHGHASIQEPIFETSTMLVTLILLGRVISAAVRLKAYKAVSLKSLQAETALLIDKASVPSKIDVRLLEYGDTILVPPHTRVVTDGQIISGSSAIDESMITGESLPVSKTTGDIVTAGTMNGSSPLNILVTRLPGRNSITDIADLVEDALQTKPRIQDLADKVAGWFIPVIVSVSLVVFTIWIVVGLRVRGKNVGESFGLAITYAIAVLAVSCPCALGLVIPMALIVAGGLAAKSGIVIKHASATEQALKTTDVIFDKTGTLTKDTLNVVDEIYNHKDLSIVEIQSLVFSLAHSNSHPVSAAVADWLGSQKATTQRLEDIHSIPGAGLTATLNKRLLKAGNPYWLGIDSHPEIRRLLDNGLTVLSVTVDSKLVATYGLRNELRPEAAAVIENLRRRGLDCHIVSGDGPRAVEDIAQKVNISLHNTASCQSPAAKQKYTKMLADRGKIVLFCGDGTNDAVAVAQAHIGVQIGSISDVTRASADVVLTGGLEAIPALLDISKQTYTRIIFSFVWSGIYNTIAVLLAAGAFVKIRIAPAYAGLGEIVSVLPVILITLTLMSFKRKPLL